MIIKSSVRSALKFSFSFIRTVFRIRKYINELCYAIVLTAFATSHLNYCNFLLIARISYRLDRLQCILNVSARHYRSPTSSFLRYLQWLPLRRARITFRLACLFRAEVCAVLLRLNYVFFCHLHPSSSVRSALFVSLSQSRGFAILRPSVLRTGPSNESMSGG